MKGNIYFAIASAIALVFAQGCSKKPPATPEEALETYREKMAKGEVKEAAAVLAQYDKTAAPSPEVRMALAEAKLKKEPRTEKDLESAMKYVSSALDISPNDTMAHLLKGRIALEMKDFDLAYGEFAIVGDNPNVSPQTRAYAYNAMGVVGMKLEDAGMARLNFFKGMHLDRRNAQIHYHLGELFSRKFDKLEEGALSQYKYFLRLAEPSDPHLKIVSERKIPDLTALIAKDKEDFAKSLGSPDPGKCAKLLEEGEKELKRGRTTKAIEKFRAAMHADGRSYSATIKFAETVQKSKAADMKLMRECVDAYVSAIKLRSKDRVNYIAAAKCSLKAGQNSRAVKILDKMLSFAPLDAEGLMLLAKAYRSQGADRVPLAKEYEKFAKSLSGRR